MSQKVAFEAGLFLVVTVGVPPQELAARILRQQRAAVEGVDDQVL
jgi:hypothetical protein